MNKKLMLLSACLLAAGSVTAQKRVSGRVVDSEGHPVAGATVRVQGTPVTTITDNNGNFSFSNVPGSAKTLSISRLGMETQNVSVKRNLNVVLKETSSDLDEAFVTTYGKTTKASFTGAAVKISGEKIAQKSTTETTNALAGELAGVQVIQGDGNPGANASIIIRGLSSLYSANGPLYIVDGVPFSGDLSGINPQDIESIDMQKDVTATALYGARGANGVVFITTKKGKQGKVNIGADVNYSVSGRWLPTYNTIKSPERYMEMMWEAKKNTYMLNNGLSAEDAGLQASQTLFDSSLGGIESNYNLWDADPTQLIDPVTGKFNSGIARKYTPEDWHDVLFRTGQKVDGNVNLSGGNDMLNFYTAIGATKDKGYLVGADFRRFTARTNIEARITSWLRGTIGLSYNNMESNAPVQASDVSNNALMFSDGIPSIYPVYVRDENGNKVVDDVLGGWKFDYGDNLGEGRPYQFGINPAGAAKLDMSRTTTDQLRGNGSLEATFLKDFRFTASIGYDYYSAMLDKITNPYYGDGKSTNGRVEKTQQTQRSITANQILNWGHTYGGAHHVSAFAGHESYWLNNSVLYGGKINMIVADMPEFGNAVNILDLTSYSYGYSLDSWFGQVAYNYDNKYFLAGSLRADGSSRFAKGNRWGTFGSVSAAWNLTRESFMQDATWLKNFKLKASWGVAGNQSLSATTLGSTMAAYYPYATLYGLHVANQDPSFILSYKGNKDLTWEKSSSFNIGAEFNIADIVEGEFNYFNRLTSDMLFMKSVPISLGYASLPVNDGKMRNYGFEFDLKFHAVRRENVSFDVRVNGTHYNSVIKEMPLDDVSGEQMYYYSTGRYAWQKDHGIYDYYLREYMGVDAETGLAKFKKFTAVYADGTEEVITDMELFKSAHVGKEYTIQEGETTTYNDAARHYTGDNALPVLQGGLGFDLRVKQFTLSATFVYALGGKAYDYVYATLMDSNPRSLGFSNLHEDIFNRWQQAGDHTSTPLLTVAYTPNAYAAGSSTRFLTSRSYLQLANVNLAYNLPDHITRTVGGLHGVQFYLSGSNLFLLSARKGFMPGTSLSGLSDTTQYLPSSSVTLGVKFQF